MMQKIEENDLGFTGLWSSAKKMNCGTLFLNPALANDVFFNKLSNVTCLDEKMIDESVERLHGINSTPYVYSVNCADLERLLERKGFVYYDTLYALKNNAPQNKKTNAVKIIHDNISLWVDVFCKAYDCLEWANAVAKIIENSIHAVDYFVDESGGSCVALYEKNNVLGLYCLGTMPDKRNKGLASLLVDFALNEVKSRHLESLILETYHRDNLLEFYSKMGFEQVYAKKVFTI
jgi:GNAT superfamily N-acetyltransferase